MSVSINELRDILNEGRGGGFVEEVIGAEGGRFMRDIDYEEFMKEQGRKRQSLKGGRPPSRRFRERATDEEQMAMYARRQKRLWDIWRSWGVVRIERGQADGPQPDGVERRMIR